MANPKMIKEEMNKVLKENRLTRNSKIVIEIDTKFNKFNENDFFNGGDKEMDLTKEVESDFHRAVFDWIERKITESDELEQEVLDDMGSYDELLPAKVESFNELGEISIRIYKEKDATNK